MAVSVEKYKNINHTLRAMQTQVIDGLDYALQTVPQFNDPRQLWDWLKPKLTFKSDGTYKGQPRELLQTMPTLMRGGVWGAKGLGDCDCFVITTLTSMIANNWDGIKIALVGRAKNYPVHIYTVIYWKGERKVLDFTNPNFNQERDTYKFIQEIPVKWKNW